MISLGSHTKFDQNHSGVTLTVICKDRHDRQYSDLKTFPPLPECM